MRSSQKAPARAHKRSHSEVDPPSPSLPSEERLAKLIADAIQPLSLNLQQNQREVKEKLSTISDTLSEIQECHLTKEGAEYLFEGLRNLERKNDQLEDKVINLQRENQALRKKTTTLELHSRRSNLRFYGLTETAEGKEDSEKLVHDFLESKGFERDERAIERAHRVGKKIEGRNRPIVVCFNHLKDRDAVWRKLGYKLFPPSEKVPHVREDFPPEIENNRSVLLSIARQALNNKHDAGKPFIRLVSDRLFLNEDSYTVESLSDLPQHLQPSSIYTPMTDAAAAFFTKSSPLSNHFACNITVNSTQYNCVEQYLMAQKASLSGDDDARKKIMQAIDPVIQKKLGKSITPPNWNNVKKAKEILLPGLRAKFSQCETAKEKLLQTGDRSIYEANPHDLFWGVGLPLHDADLWNPAKHKGKNVLGECLMLVRDEMMDKKEEKNQSDDETHRCDDIHNHHQQTASNHQVERQQPNATSQVQSTADQAKKPSTSGIPQAKPRKKTSQKKQIPSTSQGPSTSQNSQPKVKGHHSQ